MGVQPMKALRPQQPRFREGARTIVGKEEPTEQPCFGAAEAPGYRVGHAKRRWRAKADRQSPGGAAVNCALYKVVGTSCMQVSVLNTTSMSRGMEAAGNANLGKLQPPASQARSVMGHVTFPRPK